ncbi:MAG: response regulator [Planctomycetota bacterium]
MKNKKLNGQYENKQNILVVDDHPILRQGLKQLIDHEPDLVVCAEAEDAENALSEIERYNIDLAIVDISIIGTDGVGLTGQIKMRYPQIPVLILTMHDELLYAKRAFRAGAEGYVEKREAADTIITAIRKVLGGEKYISKQMAEKISRSLC